MNGLLETLGIADELKKELGNNGYTKGVEVEHKMKDIYKKLLPEEYILKGVITAELSKENGQLKLVKEKLHTAFFYKKNLDL